MFYCKSWERRGEGEIGNNFLRAEPTSDLCNGFFVAVLERSTCTSTKELANFKFKIMGEGGVRYHIIGFLAFWFHSDTPFWRPQMILKAFDLQISMTSRGQNMKSMKISHVRYQILYVNNTESTRDSCLREKF